MGEHRARTPHPSPLLSYHYHQNLSKISHSRILAGFKPHFFCYLLYTLTHTTVLGFFPPFPPQFEPSCPSPPPNIKGENSFPQHFPYSLWWFSFPPAFFIQRM